MDLWRFLQPLNTAVNQKQAGKHQLSVNRQKKSRLGIKAKAMVKAEDIWLYYEMMAMRLEGSDSGTIQTNRSNKTLTTSTEAVPERYAFTKFGLKDIHNGTGVGLRGEGVRTK